MFGFGREVCNDPRWAGQREWLVTNGIGGYASGTVAGLLTRRYHSPLAAAQQRAVVGACARHLLTSHGLRSLDPGHPAYSGHYGGDRRQRDAAYHQGIVWGRLIGPFVRAHLRVYGDPQAARSYLLPLLRHLDSHGVGSVSEIFDGDPPFTPRGCIAQAWSVAELLSAWQATGDAGADRQEGKPAGEL